jgi:hypothetical protein
MTCFKMANEATLTDAIVTSGTLSRAMPYGSLCVRDCSVIVAMRFVRMVQVSLNEVVGVRGMWNRFVPATP